MPWSCPVPDGFSGAYRLPGCRRGGRRGCRLSRRGSPARGRSVRAAQFRSMARRAGVVPATAAMGGSLYRVGEHLPAGALWHLLSRFDAPWCADVSIERSVRLNTIGWACRTSVTSGSSTTRSFGAQAAAPSTVTVNDPLAELPCASGAEQCTVVTPTGKSDPDDGERLEAGRP